MDNIMNNLNIYDRAESLRFGSVTNHADDTPVS